MSIKTIFYSILLLGVVYLLFTIGFPFLLAFVMAYLLDPVVRKLSERTKMRHLFASLIVCSIFTIIVLWLSFFVIYIVSREAFELTRSLTFLTRSISSSLGELTQHYQNLFKAFPPEYQHNLQQLVTTLSDWMQSLLLYTANILFNVAKKVPNLFVEFIIFFIATFLFSMRLPTIKPAFLALFHPNSHKSVSIVLATLSEAIFGFLRAELIILILVFIVVWLGFLILGISYPTALALLIAAIDILPILGTGSIMIPMAVYMFLTGNYVLCIGVLVHYVFILAFRRVIETTILADGVGIGALSALISMYIGFQLVGIVGLFMGPLTVLLFQTLVKVGIIKIRINC